MNEWDRRDKESDPAWAAFQTYRDMGPQRSIRKVADALGKSGTLIGQWSSRHDWPNRVKAFERWMDQETVGVWTEQLRALVEDATSVIRAFVSKTSARLAIMEDGNPIPGDVIQCVSVIVRAQQNATVYLRPTAGATEDPEPTVDVGALARELVIHGRGSDT